MVEPAQKACVMANTAPTHKQGGLALLDALLALSIVSISLVGVQQLIALRLQQTSQQLHRSQAMLLLDDMAQRIRIHTWRFGSPSAHQQFATHLNLVSSTGSAPASACKANACNATAFAAWTLAHWSYTISQTWPQAQISITAQGHRLRLLLAWPQPGANNYSWQGTCPPRHQCEVLWL